MDTKQIFSILASYFDGFKFHSSKKYWARSGSDGVSLLIEFQKSSFGGLYFLNFGVHVAGMSHDTEAALSIYRCQLIARYESFVQLNTAEYNKFFSTDAEGLGDRTHLIGKNVKELILPELLQYNSRDAIHRILTSRPQGALPLEVTRVRRDDLVAFLAH